MRQKPRPITTALLSIAASIGVFALVMLYLGTSHVDSSSQIPASPDKAHAAAISNSPRALEEARIGELLKADRYAEAEAALRVQVALDPSDANAYNSLGYALKKQGRLLEALRAYDLALALRPDHAEAMNNLAVTLEAAGMRQEAAGYYSKALKAAPASAALHLNYALLLEHLGKREEAVGHYYTFLTLSEDEGLKAKARTRLERLK